MTLPPSCVCCTRHTPRPDGSCGPQCRHLAPTVGHVCNGCLQRLRDDLDALTAATDYLAANPSSGGRGGGGERALPGGTERLSWLDGTDLRWMLHQWLRDLEVPITRVDLHTLVAAMRANVETLAHHDGVDEFAADLHRWAQMGRRLCGWDDQGSHVRCPAPDGDHECGRRLLIDVHSDERVYCSRCGTEWTSARLLLVAREGDDVWLDAEAMALAMHVHEQTIRRWARCGKVRRRGSQYSLDDARQVAY